MATTAYNEVAQELFMVLNDKERKIITKRFSLDHQQRLTLEKIGQDYDITRERVRQIEKTAISKLRRTSVKSDLVTFYKATSKTLQEFGGALTEKELLSLMSEQFPNTDKYFISLSFEISPEFEKIKKSKDYYKSWYLVDRLDKKMIYKINTKAIEVLKKEKQIISKIDFLKNIQSELKGMNLSKVTISSILSTNNNLALVEEGYGLTKWRDVRPRSIKDKALIILKRKGKPMHFKKLAETICKEGFDNKSVTTQAVHNELIRYEDFILVGRGIYALKQWGYTKGTVKDVILEILKEKGPLSKGDIITAVLEKRQVKTGTISLNLQKYPEFKRVGRAVYGL